MTSIESVQRYRGSKQLSHCTEHVEYEPDGTVSVSMKLNRFIMHLYSNDNSGGLELLYSNSSRHVRASIINYQTSLLQNHNPHLFLSVHHCYPIFLSSFLILLPSPIPILRSMLTNSILSRIRNLILQNLDKLIKDHRNDGSQRRTYEACQ